MSWLKLPLVCAMMAAPAVFAEPAVPAKDGEKKPPAGQKAKTPAAKAATSEQDKENAMLTNIPAGQIYNGVHIPNRSPSGKLLSLFDATSVKRIGDRDFEMEGLKIEIHNDDGSTFHVEMSHSVFNLDTNTLTSNTPTTIKRDDFIINSDRAEFHTKEKFGRMFGNVKMIINSGDTK